MSDDLQIDGYDAAYGREAMLRFGPARGPVVVVALPLFEEANRTRAFAVAMLRALAKRGIAGALPDLPGMGESPIAIDATTLSAMRDAFAAAVARVGVGGRRCHAMAIRSGALLDLSAEVAGRWHLAPQPGDALVRELVRIGQAAGTLPAGCDPRALTDATAPTTVAGHRIAAAMATDLLTAIPSVQRTRIVRLESDPRPADRKFAGPALWRRSEPGNDIGLADRLAGDLAEWITTCGR